MATRRVRPTPAPSGRVARTSGGGGASVRSRAPLDGRTAKPRGKKVAASGTGPSRATLEKEFGTRGVRQIKLGGFDIDGIFRGKYVSLDKFLSVCEGDVAICDVIFGWDSGDVCYDNSVVTGPHTGYPDIPARVDLSTFRIIPWEPDTAAFLLDFHTDEGGIHPASPRGLLRQVKARAEELGYAPKFSCEYEFFLFRETSATVREKGYRNLAPLSPGMFGYSWLRASEHAPLVHAILDGCREFGIPIEGLHTETGPGVYEAAIAYGDILQAADHAALFKTVVKEICSRHGVMACFMAKWNESLPGCSGHVHQSLWNRDSSRNLFHDVRGERGMSKLMCHFLAGQVELMPELTALISPTVNSYKRYVPGVWAPLNATWGHENRTTGLRAIGSRDNTTSMRIEHRQPAADLNPYITMATLLAAGLYGIEKKLEPPSPLRDDATGSKAPALPRSLDEAVARLNESQIAREILGDGFVDHYIRTRQWEVRQSQRAVTDWELARYFEII